MFGGWEGLSLHLHQCTLSYTCDACVAASLCTSAVELPFIPSSAGPVTLSPVTRLVVPCDVSGTCLHRMAASVAYALAATAVGSALLALAWRALTEVDEHTPLDADVVRTCVTGFAKRVTLILIRIAQCPF